MDLSTAPLIKLVLETIEGQNTTVDNLDSLTARTSSVDHFYLKLRKNYITRRKIERFKSSPKDPVILRGPLLKNVDSIGDLTRELPKNFWGDPSFFESLSGNDQLNILWIANNDLSGIPAESLFELLRVSLESENLLLVVWDGDNHHWSMLSSVLCMAADFYFPAHTERISYFQSINPYVPQVVPLGSCQWSTQLIRDSLSLISNRDRAEGTPKPQNPTLILKSM